LEIYPHVPRVIYSMAIRTGYKGWSTLEEYDTYHGTATGVTKPNVPSDPDYVAPVWDPATCQPQTLFKLSNVDTDHDDVYRLFVDVDLAMSVDGAPVVYLTDVEETTYIVDQGSTVLIRQLSNPNSNPWPPNSTGILEIKDQDGNTVYSNSETVQALELASYTFMPTGGVYTVTSIGYSTATGYRKYVSTNTVPGDVDPAEVSVAIYDDTTSNLVCVTGQGTGSSEFNVIDDSGNCNIEFNNETSGSLDFSISWTGGSDSFTIASNGSHILNNVPKSNYTIIVTHT